MSEVDVVVKDNCYESTVSLYTSSPSFDLPKNIHNPGQSAISTLGASREIEHLHATS
jgi:hypothetical protein